MIPLGMKITTADNKTLEQGDRAFNHYDHKAGTIERIDSWPQPDTMKGQSSSTPISEWSNYWFDFRHDDGTVALLDGSRICSIELAQRRNWV